MEAYVMDAFSAVVFGGNQAGVVLPDRQLSDEVMQKIAAEFGYHPNYISQIFKESTDKTLRDYLTHYRIRMAKNLLRTTELDVGTIGWKCGFNSVSYFIKVFRQHTGMTPHKFQKSTISQLY